jgi:hypothetical protein
MNDINHSCSSSEQPDAPGVAGNPHGSESGSEEPAGDFEMLSLIIDEAIKGVDISSRYPEYYQMLLDNDVLRQAFLDAMNILDPAIQPAQELNIDPGSLVDFLTNKAVQLYVEQTHGDKWRITLKQTIEQLKQIFSPPDLAYRSDPASLEDTWFTLLRGEVEVSGNNYAVLLECSLAEEPEEALALTLNIAVTIGAPQNLDFPLVSTLQWGDYQETIQVPEEGRKNFPNIPLSSIYDDQRIEIREDITLFIETIS